MICLQIFIVDCLQPSTILPFVEKNGYKWNQNDQSEIFKWIPYKVNEWIKEMK